MDDTVAKEVSLIQIIKQPRRRIAYFLSIGLLVGFCWFVMVHIGAKMTIWNHVLFGVTTIPILIYSSLLMISPDVIKMDDSGFSEKFLWRTTRFEWSEVRNFHPFVVSGDHFVAFDFTSPVIKRRLLRRLNRTLGAEGHLKAEWGDRVTAVCVALNAWRSRWESDQLASPTSMSAQEH